MLEVFKSLLAFYLGIQWVSVLLFLVVEWAIVDFYRFGTFKNSSSKLDKITNVGMALLIGSGYFLYSKFSKQKWIVRKLLMLVGLIIHGLLSVIIYYVITLSLEYIVSLF
ncbi:glucan phosphoethanolaminetransferase (alkaline phosphatase superfamily) [Cytobacillus horneckiae]|uniref:hypothetical protein n=1 Tax=Cytobacillus horneckiae TaxID=549687 RepID=UPI0019D00A28|nr:hypothetical protein [Cytobacillus horneckiae]MBN6889705.1 hypothetical protein [Cytobacillus horneckiae]